MPFHFDMMEFVMSSLISSFWRTPAGLQSAAPQAPTSVPQPDARSSSEPASPRFSNPPAPKRAGLRAALFQAVVPMHADVAEHRFFAALKDHSLTQAHLATYLADQEHVLAALEDSLVAHADKAALRPVFDARVTNRRGLAAIDAAALGFAALPSPTPAACRLAAQIGVLASREDYAAIAVHAWVQYNAMLNGGQQMAHQLRKLFPQTQMHLFTFSAPAAQLRQSYADAINAVPFDEAEKAHLCAEAQAAFVANANMLDATMARREGGVAHLFDDLCNASS
jgi:heme oxygenase